MVERLSHEMQKLCRPNWTFGYCLYAVLCGNFYLCFCPSSWFYSWLFILFPFSTSSFVPDQENNLLNTVLNKTTVQCSIGRGEGIDWHG